MEHFWKTEKKSAAYRSKATANKIYQRQIAKEIAQKTKTRTSVKEVEDEEEAAAAAAAVDNVVEVIQKRVWFLALDFWLLPSARVYAGAP